MQKQFTKLLSVFLLCTLLTGTTGIHAAAAVRTDLQESLSAGLVQEKNAENDRSGLNTNRTDTTLSVNAASLTWTKVGNNLRLKDSRGKYKTGFVKYRNRLYYFDKSGNLKTGFFKVGTKRYYASTRLGYKGKGQILTGIVKIGKYFYYLNPSSRPYAGVVSKGFRKVGSRRYYFNSKYHMVTGWFTVSGSRYYASCNKKGHYGALLTGVQKIGNMTYRFDSSGRMVGSLSNSARYTHMIDVSEHQGNIDFKKVKASGVKAVIIRAGHNSSNIDKYFYSNIKKAKAAGLKVGIYWFSYAYTRSMAVTEAKFCLRVIRKYSLNLPVYFDWEYDSMKKANKRGAYPGRNEITNMTYDFCNTITRGGRRAGYYFNLHYLNSYYTPSKLTRFSTWHAYWGTNSYADNIWSRANSMTAPTKYDVWQFSSRGRIPGISGNVDCDLLLKGSLLK